MMADDYIVGDYGDDEADERFRLVSTEIESPGAGNHERSRSFSARSMLLHPDLGSASQRAKHRRVASVTRLLDYYNADASVYMHISGAFDVPPLAKKSSTMHAAMLFLKSMIGTFVLYMPYLYSICGVLTGSIILVVVAVVATLNMLLLSHCYDWLRHLGGSSYGEIGAAVHGRWGGMAVDISILLSQLGFCITYMLYLAKNINQDLGLSHIDHSDFIALSVLALLLIPFSWIRKIQYLGGLMMVANVCIFAGFFATFGYSAAVLQEKGPEEVDWIFNSTNGMLLFIGSVSICFEGIGLLVPIKESMEHPEHFDGVVSVIMTILTLLFAAFGIVGYLAFGDGVEYFATLNLPQNGMGIVVRLLYSVAVFLAYPLQLFPAVEILERVMFVGYPNAAPGTFKWWKNSFRALVVCLTAFVALQTGGSFDNFVAIIGALCAVPLALIYPPLIHLKLAAGTISSLQRTAEVAVISLGCCVMVVCTTQALMTWK